MPAQNANPALLGVSVTAHALGVAVGSGVVTGFGVAIGAGVEVGAGVALGAGAAVGGAAAAIAAVIEPDCAIVNAVPLTVIVPVRVADPYCCDRT